MQQVLNYGRPKRKYNVRIYKIHKIDPYDLLKGTK